MATTNKLIEAKTLTISTATVTFTSIPATYTDLCLVISARTDTAGEVALICIDFNGDTTDANYATKRLFGAGSGNASSDSSFRSGYSIGAGVSSASGATANTFGNSSCYIPNYAGSTAKSFNVDSVAENNASTAYVFLMAGVWSGTAAITYFSLYPEYGTTFDAGSTFYLYGIKNS